MNNPILLSLWARLRKNGEKTPPSLIDHPAGRNLLLSMITKLEKLIIKGYKTVLEAPKDGTGSIEVITNKPAVKYEWYYKNAANSAFSLTGTFTGNIYTLTMNEQRNGRSVYCILTDENGKKLQTETFTFTMIE